MKSEQNFKVYDFRFDIFFACYFVSMALFVKKKDQCLIICSTSRDFFVLWNI